MKKYLIFINIFLTCIIAIVYYQPRFFPNNDNDLGRIGYKWAKVVKIIDGDTVIAFFAGEEMKIRLLNIDAPEKIQPFGTKAKKALAKMILGKKVELKCRTKKDRYGRKLCDILLEHKGEKININKEMVRQGMAWVYTKYNTSKMLPIFENQARQNKIGLWADENPNPPWIFRKNNKKN